MKFISVEDAAQQLVKALVGPDAPALRHPPLVLICSDEDAPLATRVGELLGAPARPLRVAHLVLPWYRRLPLGALTEDNHHYVDPVVAADHSIGAREIAQLCQGQIAELRGPGWRPAPPHGAVSAIVVARALSTGYRALALAASAQAGGAREVIVASPCGARDAIHRVESAARLVVLASSDGPRFDPDAILSRALASR